MDEVFDRADLARLADVAEFVWARDEPMPTDRFLDELPNASAVVFGEWRHGRDALQQAGPWLRALLEVAGGHEHPGLDHDAALHRDIAIGSCAPAFGPVVAELGLALALALHRGLVHADRDMRAGTERWLHEGNARNRTLFGATIGFVGCGGIARELHGLLAPFRPIVQGYDPPIGAEGLSERGIISVGLDQMFDEADVIFVTAPPTAATHGLVSHALLERLGPHQSIVVLSRASVIDFDALVELSDQHGFRFGTDVHPVEPAPLDHPVRDARNGVATPHIAGALPDALQAIGEMVVDDLIDVLDGRVGSRMQYLTPRNRAGLMQTKQTGSGWNPTGPTT